MAELIEACESGDINRITSYIRDFHDWHFDSKESALNLGLSYACKAGHLHVVNFMIAQGANDWPGGLCNACSCGHMPIVQLMIAKGADNWNQGLVSACLGGHMPIVQLMISKGANGWNFGFCKACNGGNIDIVRLMISKGANMWNCGLCNACSGGHMEIIKLMIGLGANNWAEALWSAYSEGHLHVVQLMISISEIAPFELKGPFKELDLSSLNTKRTFGASIIDSCCKWPKDQIQICKLIDLGTPVESFMNIYGYQGLLNLVSKIRDSILGSNVLLSDLLNIVTKCIIV